MSDSKKIPKKIQREIDYLKGMALITEEGPLRDRFNEVAQLIEDMVKENMELQQMITTMSAVKKIE